MAARMAMGVAKRVGLSMALAGMLAAGSGCVAFNVGEPEVYRKTLTRQETAGIPSAVEVQTATGEAWQTSGNVMASIAVDVHREYPRSQWEETAIVRVQKRLSVGLFPNSAEYHLMPDGALEDAGGNHVCWTVFRDAVFLPLSVAVMPLQIAIAIPTGEWDYWRIWWGLGAVKGDLETSSKSTLRALEFFSKAERYQMGFIVRQLKDDRSARTFTIWHTFWPVGWHRYSAVFVDLETGPRREAAPSARNSREALSGPYEVEFRIPALDYVRTGSVGPGKTNAVFVLPRDEDGGRYEAAVTFHPPSAGDNGMVEQAFQKMGDWTVKTTVQLQAKPKPKPEPEPTESFPPAETHVVREVVREIHHYHEAERTAREFDVEKASNGAGRTVWRVRILAEQLNAFDADRKAKPRILENLRDEFAERNPEVPCGEIKAWATYTTEDGGRTLVYEGEASALIPSLESLAYDAGTRKGSVTMKLSPGADLKRSKEFVRRNISAIVCDKNVVLAAGERPPDGALYKSLDENFADGVLTVEFEAVE